MPSIFVRAESLLYWLFGPKNQSFRNNSGKAQPIRTKFGTRGHVKGWQRSWNFGRDRLILGKMGAGTIPAEREFFLCGNPRDFSATSQRLIFTKFGHGTYFRVLSRNPERLSKFFTLGAKSEIESRSNRHLTQSRLQVTGCTAEIYCVYSTL